MTSWLNMYYWVTCSNCYEIADSYLEKCPRCGEVMKNGIKKSENPFYLKEGERE